ncbi:MAG: TMEM43 family protein [Bdellovibrionales bacterium]
MSDVVTVKKGFGKKAKNAFAGVLIGILFFLGSFPLLWWNEGRSVKRIKTINEGRELVVSVPSTQVSPDNQNQLIHISGFANTKRPIQDALFGVSDQAIKIKRTVEMYQWEEDKKESENKTTYSYNKIWSEKHINSANFHTPSGHKNPDTMPYNSQTYLASDVFIDAFNISKPFVKKMNAYEPYALTQQDAERMSPQFQQAFKISSNYYFFGNPQSPQVGAMRVKFETVKPMDMSVMGKQNGEWVEVFQTKHGTLSLVDEGVVDAFQMLQNAEDENTMITWMLRGLGFVLMWAGLGILFGPIKMLANYVPIFGTIFEGAVMIVTGLVAIVLSSMTIAIAWFFYRPLLSLALLSLAGGALYMLVKNRKDKVPLPEVDQEAPATS